MERRGSSLDAQRRLRTASRSGALTWHDAVCRGAIFGSVLAGHLVILTLVLHPSWQRRQRVAPQQDGNVLRLTFDAVPKVVRVSPVHATARMPAKTKPVPSTLASSEVMSAVVMRPTNSPPSTATTLIVVAPTTTDDLHRGYQPGDFQTALQDAQRTNADHIPGAAIPRIGGIRLQARSSVSGTVHMLAEANRCTNEQFRLQDSPHRFTPEMIDRALEASGCGPHLEHTQADATIDVISHHAIFGN